MPMASGPGAFKKMIVIAHRANSEGIDKSRENTLQAIGYCLEKDWGVETDIRRSTDGRFYISHDLAEVTDSNEANAYFELLRKYPDTIIALNVKELGYEADLLRYLDQQGVSRQVFLFDMELLEDIPGRTARLFRQLDHGIRLAARVSDRGETVDQALAIEPAEYIWLDEFDRLWATEADIRQLKSAGKIVYAISPEIHGFSLEEMKRRWHQFHAWEVDGICTDYSSMLAEQIKNGFQEIEA